MEFLKLMYPRDMLLGTSGKVVIDQKNIFDVIKLADKYAAINIKMQCMEETRNLKQEKAMYLLPYAVRYDLPHQQIFDIIS